MSTSRDGHTGGVAASAAATPAAWPVIQHCGISRMNAWVCASARDVTPRGDQVVEVAWDERAVGHRHVGELLRRRRRDADLVVEAGSFAPVVDRQLVAADQPARVPHPDLRAPTASARRSRSRARGGGSGRGGRPSAGATRPRRASGRTRRRRCSRSAAGRGTAPRRCATRRPGARRTRARRRPRAISCRWAAGSSRLNSSHRAKSTPAHSQPVFRQCAIPPPPALASASNSSPARAHRSRSPVQSTITSARIARRPSLLSNVTPRRRRPLDERIGHPAVQQELDAGLDQHLGRQVLQPLGVDHRRPRDRVAERALALAPVGDGLGIGRSPQRRAALRRPRSPGAGRAAPGRCR